MSETYGQEVRRRRRARGWTQEQLAEASGVPKRTLQDIEGDKHARPQRANVLALNAALDIEGDPEEERRSWDDDVQRILDIMGAYLMTLTPAQRLEWMTDVMKRALHL